MNKLTKVMISTGLLTLAANIYATADWQPMPGEQLIKLPAPIMAKAIDRDFLASPLAAELDNSQENVASIQKGLGDIQTEIKSSTGDDKVELQHQFLEQKSAYLDEMEHRQELKIEAVSTRIEIYNQVLDELKHDRRSATDPVSREVREAQLHARERMQRVTDKVDEMFYPDLGGETSKYNQEYAHNLDKLQSLQRAIQTHDANRAMTIDGDEISREDFVRKLLGDAEAEQALIEQENEMLSYMARLVALDAQALQMAIAYGDDADVNAQIDTGRPATMVDYFIN